MWVLKSDEKRSHRLNSLLRFYVSNDNRDDVDRQLFVKARLMGVSIPTAKDYCKTVILQYKSMKKK